MFAGVQSQFIRTHQKKIFFFIQRICTYQKIRTFANLKISGVKQVLSSLKFPPSLNILPP